MPVPRMGLHLVQSTLQLLPQALSVQGNILSVIKTDGAVCMVAAPAHILWRQAVIHIHNHLHTPLPLPHTAARVAVYTHLQMHHTQELQQRQVTLLPQATLLLPVPLASPTLVQLLRMHVRPLRTAPALPLLMLVRPLRTVPALPRLMLLVVEWALERAWVEGMDAAIPQILNRRALGLPVPLAAAFTLEALYPGLPVPLMVVEVFTLGVPYPGLPVL